jgi:hypothetical protein
VWSGWQPVDPDIDGNHIVLVIWRGRLNVFWVTFINQSKQPGAPPTDTSNNQPVSGLDSNNLINATIVTATAEPQVKVQLHWVEYFQGKWSKRISSDVNKQQPLTVWQDFDPDDIPIYVTKEIDANGNEGAVKIHLGFAYPDDGVSFRVTSKNCAPDFGEQYWEPAPEMVYLNSAPYPDATLYTNSSPYTDTGSGSLSSDFQTAISSDGTTAPTSEKILDTLNDFALLPCANPVAPPFLKPSEQLYWEAGALVAPFFFKDAANPNAANQSTFFDELTFFVQPSLTEQTVTEWEGWALAPSVPTGNWSDPSVVNSVNVVAQVPTGYLPATLGDPIYSKFSLQSRDDWATNQATAISFGNALVGKMGGLSVGKVLSLRKGVGVSRAGFGGMAGAILAGGAAGARSGLMVVGGQGLRLGQLQFLRTSQNTASAEVMSRS